MVLNLSDCEGLVNKKSGKLFKMTSVGEDLRRTPNEMSSSVNLIARVRELSNYGWVLSLEMGCTYNSWNQRHGDIENVDGDIPTIEW